MPTEPGIRKIGCPAFRIAPFPPGGIPVAEVFVSCRFCPAGGWGWGVRCVRCVCASGGGRAACCDALAAALRPGPAGCSEGQGGFSNKNAIFLPTCLQVRKFCLPLHSQWKRNAFRFLRRRGASLVADQEIGTAVVEVADGFSRNGAIAQLVEQRTENPCVPGSIPGGTTSKAEYSIWISGL